MMDLDNVLEHIGGFGRYQILIFVLMGLVQFQECGYLLGIVFIGETFEHFCKTPDDAVTTETFPNSSSAQYNATECSLYPLNGTDGNLTACTHGWTFMKDATAETVVTEWELVCDKDYVVDLSSSVFVAGLMTGALLVTPLSDRFGRKSVLLSCLFLRTVLAFCLAFTQDFVQFVILRFFIGALHRANCIISYIILTEVLPPRHRTKPGIALQFFWAGGLMELALVAYLLPNWRHFELAICLPTLLMVSYYWIVPESPRWLICQGRYKEAKSLLKKAAKFNKTSLPPDLFDTNESAQNIPLPKLEDGCLEKNGLHPVVNGLVTTDRGLCSCNSRTPLQECEQTDSTLNSSDNFAGCHVCSDKNGEIESVLNACNSRSPLQHSNGTKPMEDKYDDESEHTKSYKESLLNGQSCEVPEARGKMLSQMTSFIQMFKSRTMLKWNLILYYLWIVNSLAYYGISLSTSDLAGNKYLNFFLSGAVELPAYVIVMFVLERCGRCKPMCVFQILSGVSNVITVFIPTTTASGTDLSWLITVLAMIGKFGITGSFCSLLLYSAEIYPTSIRNTAYGIASFWDTLGGMAAPFILYQARLIPELPRTLFGTAAILAGALMLVMPETANKPMPETVAEVERWNSETSIGQCCKRRPVEQEGDV